MTHPHDRALEAAARALADYRYLNFERNSDFLVAHARAAVTAYLESLIDQKAAIFDAALERALAAQEKK
jgi:hypothetical protein